jgi:hypothetical protein
MNNRAETDFLCESTSFLTGFGSVLNLKGDLYDYNNSTDNPDAMAIGNDWQMIGQDISDSIAKAKTEFVSSFKK